MGLLKKSGLHVLIATFFIFSNLAVCDDDETVQIKLDHLEAQQFSRRTDLLNAFRRAITEPGGVAYFRTIATGVQVGGAVEGINLQRHLESFARILQRTPPSEIRWNNVALLWGSYFPDDSDVGTIRQLAIDLQDWDINGRENYADLRQEVHNRPTSATVERLRKEMEKVQQIVENFTGSETVLERERVRLRTLTELYELEKKFWGGSGIDGEEIRNFVSLYQAEQDYQKLIPADSDSSQAKVQKITELRTKMRSELGVDGVSMAALMSSKKPLTAQQAQALTTFLSFDRRMATEAQRQLAMLSPSDIRKQPKQNLRLLSDMMVLDSFISPRRGQELHHLSNNIAEHAERIRTLLGEPIGRLQQGFGAMQSRLEELNKDGGMEDTVRGAQDPSSLIEQTDNEVRSSLLFDVGNIGQVISRSHSDPVESDIDGKREKSSDSEIVLPIRKPISGKVFVIRNDADLKTAVEYASSGTPLILVKLTPLDIDPPPAEVLITIDPTLNQASHMAMRAKDAGMGHLNFLSKDSPLLKWLLAQEGEQIQIRADAENANRLYLNQGGTSQGKQEKLKIDTLIDENYARPVTLTELIHTEQSECKSGVCLSGGKGRGLAVILSELATQKRNDNPYRIPEGVQVPYGLFREWFSGIGLLSDWEKALKEGPDSIKWDRLMRDLNEKAIPPGLLDRIVKSLGGAKGLGEGWFVRSNSNSEDGGFNGAGINLTIPDVKNESELRKALAQVFLATYGPNARAWWARMFENPEAVRSQVLLMKTIAASHSSVAVISSDGTRMTIESLPGVGSNVVDGKGVAERLTFEINPKTGEVKQIVMVTPAMSNSLKVWEGTGASRKVSDKNLIYYGKVLSAEQQKAIAAMAHDLRKTADGTAEFKGKPLDIEIAWTGNSPHLVQIRRAPAEPQKASQSSWKLPKETNAIHKPAKYGFSFEVLVKSVLSDLQKSTGKISTATQLKIATLNNQVQHAGNGGHAEVEKHFDELGGSEVVAQIRRRGAELLKQVSRGEALAEAGVHEAQTLKSLFDMMPISKQNRGDEDFFPDSKRSEIKELIHHFFHKHYGPKDAQAFLTAIRVLYPYNIDRISQEVFSTLPDEKANEVLKDGATGALGSFAQEGVRHELERLSNVLRYGSENEAKAAHKRLKLLLGTMEATHNSQGGHSNGRPTTRFLYERLIGHLKEDHPDIAFRNRYDTAARKFLDHVGVFNASDVWHLHLDDNEETETAERHLREVFDDYRSVRHLAQFREKFHRKVLEEEMAKAPNQRNLEAVVVILNDSADRSSEHGKQVLKAVKTILADAKISITPFVGSGVEVRYCTDAAMCRLSFLIDKNLGDLLWAKNIEIDPKVDHVKLGDGPQYPGTFVFDIKGLPSAEEIAKSPAKIFLLLAYLSERSVESGDGAKVSQLLRKVLEERMKLESSMSVEDWFAIFQRNSLLRMRENAGLAKKIDGLLKAQLPKSLTQVKLLTETIQGKQLLDGGHSLDIQLKLTDPQSKRVVATIELSHHPEHGGKDWKLGINIGGVSIQGADAHSQDGLFSKEGGVSSLIEMLEETFHVDLKTPLGISVSGLCEDLFNGAPKRTVPHLPSITDG